MRTEREELEPFTRRLDEPTFRRLYREYTPRLFALALRLNGGSWLDAEESVQEAWVRAIEGLSGFRGGSSFSTWLSGILVNCHREHNRRRTRETAAAEPNQVHGALAEVAAFPRSFGRADPIDVERAIARLADGYREVVVLYDLNGYTHREIADLLGIDVGTSKSQLARGRARLRELLRDDRAADADRTNDRGAP